MADRYWVGGSGTWDAASTSNWSTTSGGASGASAPTNADNVIFDANSGVAATVSVAASAVCLNCTIDKSDISLSLTGAPTFSGAITLTQGSLVLNTYTLTSSTFASVNSNSRTIDFGSGKIVVTGSGIAWTTATATNLVVAGEPNVEIGYTGSVAVTVRSGVLTEAQAISFSFTGGTYPLTFFAASNYAAKNVDFTGFSGTLGATSTSIVYGSLTLSPTMTLTASTASLSFRATSGIKTITCNGQTLDMPVNFNGVGGTWRLADNLTVGSTRTVTLTNGTLDGNGQNVSLGSFALGSGTKTLTLGSGTWTVVGSGTAWNANTNIANLTVSASTGTINMTSASAKTFAGGGKTWPTLNQGGAGALTIQQSNTFTNITNTVQPATITLTSGTTQTVTSFGVSGTAGSLITLNSSSAGSQATLSDNSGVNSVSYTSIKDINATGGSIWDAPTTAGNVDAGNNLGWNFGIPFNYDIEFSPALRSFTERKQF